MAPGIRKFLINTAYPATDTTPGKAAAGISVPETDQRGVRTNYLDEEARKQA